MLDGLRVLDFTRILAGPYCAMLMADLGADVIKVERPGRGDDARYLGGKAGMSAVFASVNRSKRSVAIDLAKPEGQRLAFELARRADVILENVLPGGAVKMGIGYDAVRAANPTVVYVSITGFGQTGPYAQRPGYNTIAMGMSGLIALTGSPGHPPTRPGGSLSDLTASFWASPACGPRRPGASPARSLRSGPGPAPWSAADPVCPLAPRPASASRAPAARRDPVSPPPAPRVPESPWRRPARWPRSSPRDSPDYPGAGRKGRLDLLLHSPGSAQGHLPLPEADPRAGRPGPSAAKTLA